MGKVLEQSQLIIHVKVFINDWGGLGICGHIISCCFSQREIGARRRIPCAEYMASVLMDYYIGSGILPPQKTEWVLIAGEDYYLEEHTLYIRGDGVLVLTESQKYKIKFWSRPGPTNKFLFKDVPWNLEAPLRRTLPGLFGFTTGWCGKVPTPITGGFKLQAKFNSNRFSFVHWALSSSSSICLIYCGAPVLMVIKSTVK